MKKRAFLSRTSTSETQQRGFPADIPRTFLVPERLPDEFLAIIQESRQRTDRSVRRCKPTAAKAGIGVSTLWRDVKAGVFVPPIRISEFSVAWVDAEIDAILSAKALMSRTNQTISMQLFVSLLIAPSNK